MSDPRYVRSGTPQSDEAVRHDAYAQARLERTLATILIGESRPMRQLRATIVRTGTSTLPVLVLGPTGAGKELVARALHLASGRMGRLVAFNVCAVADALFESAVFGHVRGAFTGAVADSPGYLTEAHQGTAFLDEIGALPLTAQAKLLRAVELREFRPVGASRDRQSDFRVVSATNADVEALTRAGHFRADLAERLGGIVLDVPPLSARREDIPALVAHFAATGSRGGPERRPSPHGVTAEFSPEAIELLQRHPWPRNVRQLRHVVERALAWSADGMVDADAVRAALPTGVARTAGRGAGRPESLATIRAPAKVAVAECAHDDDHRHEGEAAPLRKVDGAAEDAFQQRRLAAVLRACGGDTARAAGMLGVSRATVYRRMNRLGVRLDA